MAKYLVPIGNSKVAPIVKRGRPKGSTSKKSKMRHAALQAWETRRKNGFVPKGKPVAPVKVAKSYKKRTPDWSGRTEKKVARAMVFDLIMKSRLIGLILTLPAVECILERALLQKISRKFRFHACEFGKKLYRPLFETIKSENLPMIPYFGKIADLIDIARQDDYAHLILDYCGEFTTFKKEVAKALEKKIVKVGGIVTVTFSKRDGTKSVDVQQFLAAFGDYKLMLSHDYCEKKTANHNKGAAMMLLAIKRIR